MEDQAKQHQSEAKEISNCLEIDYKRLVVSPVLGPFPGRVFCLELRLRRAVTMIG